MSANPWYEKAGPEESRVGTPPPMPIAETAFAAITPELAEWLDMLVAQRPRKEIAVAFGLADSTVRDRFLKLETLAGCADQRELARWLLENKKAWLLCGL